MNATFAGKLVISKENFKINIHKIMLCALLFSGAALYSLENNKYYIYVVMMVCTGTFFYCLIKPRIIVRTIQSKYFWWVVALFTYYMVYGLFLSSYGEFNEDYIFFVAIIILNVVIWFIDIKEEYAIEILIDSAIWASILLIIFILINEQSNLLSGEIRIGDSASGNVNSVGLYLGVFSILTLYKILFEGKSKYLTIYSLQVVFMLLTGSKKALIFIIFGFGLMYLLKNRLKVYKYIIPIALIYGLFILITQNDYFYGIIGKRTIDFLGEIGFNITGASYSYSTEQRKQMIEIGWQAFKDNPIFGGGWLYFSDVSGMGTYSHNNYIELLVTYGIMGFIFYYSMFIFVLIKLNKMLTNCNYAKMLFVLLVAILINDFAAVTFYDTPRYYIVLFFAYLLVKKQKKEAMNYERTYYSYRL